MIQFYGTTHSENSPIACSNGCLIVFNFVQTRQVCTTKLILAIHPEAVNSLDWTQAPESNPVDIKIEAIRSAPAVKVR